MMTRRNAAVVAISMILVASALPTAAHPQAQSQDVAADLVAVCPAQEEPIEIAERPELLGALPAGVAVTALAHHSALQLPEGTDFVLSLDRLTLAAGTETKSRRTVGPTLFLVEEGTMAVIENGRPRHSAGRPGSSPGESVLVERNRLVKLQNQGNDAGSVLLLGILPPEGQLPIGPFGAPASIWIPFPEEREQVVHRQMLSGEVGGLAREETLLFAACLHWTDPASEIATTRYPGPVGLLVLRGQALINDTERVGPGSCWLTPSFTSLRVQAGEQAPDIVFFGALKTSAQPQIATGGSDASSSLDCAGPTDADQT
jgi:hypothetical protein